MRRLNAAQKMAVELLGEKHLVSATIDASCGVFPPFASVVSIKNCSVYNQLFCSVTALFDCQMKWSINM